MTFASRSALSLSIASLLALLAATEIGCGGSDDAGAGGASPKGSDGGAGQGGAASASGASDTAGGGGEATGSGGRGTSTGGGSSTSGAGGEGGASAGGGGSGGEGGASACEPGETEACYSGPAGTEGVGLCVAGIRTCNAEGTAFGPCEGEVTPAPETCDTRGDDDCDGETNEEGPGCTCVPGEVADCYSGPAGTEGVGPCKGGQQTCKQDGTGWGECMGEVVPNPETCRTVEDDDCDGQVNEEGNGCACLPGSTAPCYSGPPGTEGVGVCKAGQKTCSADGTSYGPCTGEVLPKAETCDTPTDDDCDGQVNEEGAGCVCVPGSTEECYSGPPATKGVAGCKAGQKTCNAQGTGFGACVGEVLPKAETCDTPADDDCDGQVNEEGAGCVCLPNSTAPCYTGPAGTENVGLCKAGTKTCNSLGTAYGACIGQVTPVAETCNTPGDDDCDGQTNESGAGCSCVPGSTKECYSGPPATKGVGPCKAGMQTCKQDGTGYGACVGEVTPVAETCQTAADDDCDGQVNESGAGCVCLPNSTAPCYTGPGGTENVGLCKAGTKTCNSQGTAYGACVGQVTPVAETCNTPGDDDCDGQTNESGAGCVCVPNSQTACYTGPAGTENVGPCKGGTKSCNSQGTAYGACNGEVTPVTETCNTPVDDDCDGQTNESGAGCVCLPNSTAPCYTGPAGTENVGLCKGGTKTCNSQGTAYGACVGQVTPVSESCQTPGDDDCDGQVNEGCQGGGPTYADVKPIYQAKCSPCHAGGGSGGHNIATTYADALLASYYCPGKTKGECTIVRIKDGSMPFGAGCTGNPAQDAGNPACLTAPQQQLIQDWIDGGMKP